MHEHIGLQTAIGIVAIGLAIGCFIVYLAYSFNWTARSANQQVERNAAEAVNQVRGLTQASAAEIADLVKSLATLSQSLVKAGPALWSMMGAVLFLLVAATAAGVFSGETTPKKETSTGASEKKTDRADTMKAESAVLPGSENLDVRAQESRK